MFVKTQEYLEFEESMKELLKLTKDPINIIRGIILGSSFIGFYFMMIILADIIEGVH